jgi:YidC/Oxa1 family membrane protein insertase
MDQKRLFAAIAISIGILLLFDLYNRPAREAQVQRQQQVEAAGQQAPRPGPDGPLRTPTDAAPAAGEPRAPAARLPVQGPRVQGTLSLRGARLDDLVLRDYRETTAPNSPLVRMLAPREGGAPYYAQWGWTSADGRTAVPGNDTDWQAEGGPLSPGSPVTLRWDNGQGQIFEIVLSLDSDFMVTAEQRVRNTAAEPVSVLPWVRVRRERTPPVEGWAVLHEGFTGVLDGRLREVTYASAKDEAAKRAGVAFEQETTGGWAGFTDKYWLSPWRRWTKRPASAPPTAPRRTPGRAGPRTAGRWTSPPPARCRCRPAPRAAGRRCASSPAPRRSTCWTGTRTGSASPTSTKRWTSAGSTS